MNEHLQHIKKFYDQVCAEFNLLRLHVVFDLTLECRGLYVEIPFCKVYLNPALFNENTVYHELFHHVRPDLLDGAEFESKLNNFIRYLHKTKLIYETKRKATYC